MIYVTGDTHGDLMSFYERLYVNNVKDLATVMIAGDFGFIWSRDERRMSNLKALERLPVTICFADGNHENFDWLYTFPEEEWNGGMIHRIAENIIHLKRGQVFNIEGKRFFTFGGAYSVDKAYRKPFVSWWEQELPTFAEYETGAENLRAVDFKVDFVLTHQIPNRFIYLLNFSPNRFDGQLTAYFDFLYDELDFSRWFAGHWHINESFDSGKMNILYDSMIEIE